MLIFLFFIIFALKLIIELSYVVQVRAEGPEAPSSGRMGET